MLERGGGVGQHVVDAVADLVDLAAGTLPRSMR